MAIKEIGSCRDKYGDRITFGLDGGTVIVTFWEDDEHTSAALDADKREQFQRLFMEAERRAETGEVSDA